ncbi:SusD/RagB family nutrient-binding outer membrane lipoprotein [Prolixibacteraceae bacterium JC049]|nr:SusD/RagB family nutrient-binding outer membrane lipoprotein [Prolixibacteraceae bacterium JC049]
MKKLIYIFLTALLFSCTEGFDEINTNPSNVNDPSLNQLLPSAMRSVGYGLYYRYYYQMNPQTLPFAGYTVPSLGGNSREMHYYTAGYNPGISNVMNYSRDIAYRIDNMDEADQQSRLVYKGVCNVLRASIAIMKFGATGEQQYTEAGLAKYTNPPLLKPRFDSQEEIIPVLFKELDDALVYMNTAGQAQMGSNDIMYNGSVEKWSKLANTLKLKLAVYLVHRDRDKALKVAQEVASSEYGYIDNIADDWFFPYESDYKGEGSGWNFGYAAKNFVDFLRDNKDPRLFWFFNKNDFNPKVIQAFIDNNKELPHYIKERINLDAEGNFESWKGAGEPWVRYEGMPTIYDKATQQSGDYPDYFDQTNKNKLVIGDESRTYLSTSGMQNRLFQSLRSYEYPSLPGESAIKDDPAGNDFKLLLCSAAEANLYLAELSAYGASLPKSTAEYLKAGARHSFDRVAAMAERTKTLYLHGDPAYNDDEATKLTKDAYTQEIEDYLNSELFDLSTDKLEKVYLQQYIDLYSRVEGHQPFILRSGLPKVDSKYLPWEFVNPVKGGLETWARRPFYGPISETEYLKEQLQESYTRQGFTLGSKELSVLASERFWWDENNPSMHAGPKQ